MKLLVNSFRIIRDMKKCFIILFIIFIFQNLCSAKDLNSSNYESICDDLIRANEDSVKVDYADYYHRFSSFKLAQFLETYDILNVNKTKVEEEQPGNVNEGADVIDEREDSYEYRLRHIFDKKSIKDIQSKTIDEKEALLDIFVCDSCTYIFVMTVDTLDLLTINISRDTLKAWTNNIINPLYEAADIRSLEFNIDLAHRMYKEFFEPVEVYLSGKSSLIIVPDDIFIAFPFECLVISKNFESIDENILYQDMADIQFLIHKYTISYNYSTYISLRRVESLKESKSLGRRLMTLGLINADAEKDHTKQETNLFRESTYASNELEKVTRLLWRNDNYSGRDLNSNILKHNCSNYRWFHFTTPVILDINDFGASYIYLGEDKSNNEKRIGIQDILDCHLRSDLVTLSRLSLSSTEKLKAIVSIPEAFLIAGSRSVLHNLWIIDDITTSKFMSKYYYELKYKRETNARALQVAKISSMKGTVEIEETKISRAHPYFWATYILIGDSHVRPPSFSAMSPKMVIIVVYIIVFSLSFIIIRRTISSENSGK